MTNASVTTKCLVLSSFLQSSFSAPLPPEITARAKKTLGEVRDHHHRGNQMKNKALKVIERRMNGALAFDAVVIPRHQSQRRRVREVNPKLAASASS